MKKEKLFRIDFGCSLKAPGSLMRESYRDNVCSIRIVHGKGIGVLRNAVRLHLESHKLIKSIGPTDKDHGGEGVTEAKPVDINADLL